MIRQLLNRFYQFGRAEYWRTRCLNAEIQLEAETLRNRAREDFLATVYVQGIGVINPLLPRGNRAAQRISPPAQTAGALRDPFEDLGPVDRMEFETNWVPDAKAHNIPIDQAKQKFLQEIAKRKTLSDDYQM